MVARGVLSSWDTLEMKSFFRDSLLSSSAAILLMPSMISSYWLKSSRGWKGSILVEKSPRVMDSTPFIILFTCLFSPRYERSRSWAVKRNDRKIMLEKVRSALRFIISSVILRPWKKRSMLIPRIREQQMKEPTELTINLTSCFLALFFTESPPYIPDHVRSVSRNPWMKRTYP